MKAANKQIGIFVVKIPELAIYKMLAPERRYARRWLARIKNVYRVLYFLFLKKPSLVRVYAPGARPQEEHEWKSQHWLRASRE